MTAIRRSFDANAMRSKPHLHNLGAFECVRFGNIEFLAFKPFEYIHIYVFPEDIYTFCILAHELLECQVKRVA
jgi:hypothetical protein